MKKIFLCTLAAMTLFAACEKDTPIPTAKNSIPVVASPYGGNKAYINSENRPCWDDGDQIRMQVIGGSANDGTINISHNGGDLQVEASATGYSHTTGSRDTYAGYPLELFSGKSLNNSTSITLPDHYDYIENTSGGQKLTCPMAAQVELGSNGEMDVLKFVNLCTLLEVHVPKPTAGAFIIDKITVEASGTSHLSGTATVNFENLTMSLTGTGDIITLNFPNGTVALDAPKTFYIPIPSVASGTTLTIKIYNQLLGSSENDCATKTITARSQSPANTIAEINVAQDAVNAKALDGYTLYNYIENLTGDSYIDLGVKPTSDSKMQVTFMITEDGINNHRLDITGSKHASGRPLYFTFTGDAPSTLGWSSSFYSTSNPSNSSYVHQATNGVIGRNKNVKYQFTAEIVPGSSSNTYRSAVTFAKFNNNGIISSQVTQTTPTDITQAQMNEMSGDGGVNICVFATGPTTCNPAGMRLYAYKVWRGGELLFDFVPARKTDGNKIGVYNKATKEFIEATNGSFQLGND